MLHLTPCQPAVLHSAARSTHLPSPPSLPPPFLPTHTLSRPLFSPSPHPRAPLPPLTPCHEPLPAPLYTHPITTPQKVVLPTPTPLTLVHPTLAAVPPGSFIQGGSSLTPCGPGSFRERWLLASDPRATSCTPCGTGISSEPRDLDEHPLAANGSLVRATSTSCCKWTPCVIHLSCWQSQAVMLPSECFVSGVAAVTGLLVGQQDWSTQAVYVDVLEYGFITPLTAAACSVTPAQLQHTTSLTDINTPLITNPFLAIDRCADTVPLSACRPHPPQQPHAVIEAGQGMIASGRNTFTAWDCPENTYGASGKVYGLTAAPCKPCPRNMITAGLARVNNSDMCINPDGFGYASEGASRCAPGFYALKGSRKPCQACPSGRTTTDDTALQRLPTDCYVKPGFGVVSSSGNASDGFITDTSGLADADAAALPVLECPIGYYGAGLTVRSTCALCPIGSMTEEPGRTSIEQCSSECCLCNWLGSWWCCMYGCGWAPLGSYRLAGWLVASQYALPGQATS